MLELNVLLDDRMSIELLKRTPSSYLGSCRYKLPDPDVGLHTLHQLFTLFDKYDICAVFYIGVTTPWTPSQSFPATVSAWAAACGSSVCPKPIDNDLCLTDHTPGYGSAAKYIATILKEVIRDSSVYDIRSVTVAEIMGRHAGWLAGAACLAGGDDCEGPDLILLPEVPFDQDKFLAKVDELQRRKSNVIIAASEGVKTADGTYLCDLVSTAGQLDAFGHKAVLSGTSRLSLRPHPRQAELQEPCHRVFHPAALRQPSGQPHGCERSLRCGRCRSRSRLCGRDRPHDRAQAHFRYPYQCITESVDVQQVQTLKRRCRWTGSAPDGCR